jgi:3-deoxy-D-manno-octulosonate 8-phosphate phosphatase (KDO 8-P phosphatase)
MDPQPFDLAKIRFLVLDVDGILTDGFLYIADDGTAMKRFAIVDGAGLVYWRRAGLKVAIISGHASEAVTHRFRGLGIEEVHVGVADKLATFLDVMKRHGLSPSEAAVMGDDLMDLALLRRAGFAATVTSAHEECRRIAHYIAERPAGSGAVREVIELILRAQGRLDAIVESYRS